MSVASKVTIKQFFTYCIERNLPFAFYRLPEEKSVKVIAQKTSSLVKTPLGNKQFNQKGFLFVPFQEDEHFNRVIIKPDIFCNDNNLPKLNFAVHAIEKPIIRRKPKQKEASKKQFLKYLRNIQHQIIGNNFKKIVAARAIKEDKPKKFNPIIFFQLLCEGYPDAFVSLIFTKDYGLWLGATPEILLSASRREFKTYSLAGTKENTERNSQAHWGKKEKQEQKIVSDYVKGIFSSFTKEKPFIEGPKAIEAGNLLHLRTTFTYTSIPYSNWPKIIQQLHPTPAVAGSPKKEAIEFILKNENSNRSFYSGYLGPVNLDKQINLFVNLRCMNILKNKLIVYTGCGITTDSKPMKEWKETQLKSETLLALLKKKK